MTLDEEDVDAIARRVVELVAPPPPRLLDARELAERLGVTRGWVYVHAQALGAVRLGTGPRAPLRFDLELARRAATPLAAPDGWPKRDLDMPKRSRRRRPAPGVHLIEGRSGR